jgi:iron complex outermembrane receptor protein
VWTTHFIGRGVQTFDDLGNVTFTPQAPDPGYVVRNNTLVSANFSGVPGSFYGIYDQISRPDEKATSNYVSFDAEYRVSDALELSGQIGTSRGHGKTPTQDVSETLPGAGNGASWQLQGIGSAPNFALGDTDNSTPFPGGTPVDFGWIFGAQFVDVDDQEDWAQIDADFTVDRGAWTGLQFGVRYNEHQRESRDAISQGPTFSGGTTGGGGVDPAAYPDTFTHYPSDFNTFGGNFPTDVWFWSPSQLAEYNGGGNTGRDAIERAWFPLWFDVEEENAAGYVQANFKGGSWSGNLGLRYVRTDEHVVTYTDDTTPADPDAILGSVYTPQGFKGIPVDNTYDDWLPSANLKWDISDELVARFAAGRSMTRADYSSLGGSTNLIPPGNVGGTGSGSGGNPDLEPIRSWNYDAGLEWYFADNSLLAATVFYMDLENYVTFGSETKTYFTYGLLFPDGADVDYLLTVPVNAEGRVQGIELSYQQAITENFGIAANYTYADGEQTSGVTSGDDRLVGTSEDTYNLSAYYETARFNARVTYTFRSAYFSGLDRGTAFTQDDTDNLAASISYIFSDNFSVTLDGQNLNDPTLKYYARNTDQPRAFYKNGAQYYLNLRVKF